jgi:hypothetical protein
MALTVTTRLGPFANYATAASGRVEHRGPRAICPPCSGVLPDAAAPNVWLAVRLTVRLVR